MPFCNDYKLTFIHIPNTAGTSISTLLKLGEHNADYFENDKWINCNNRTYLHCHLTGEALRELDTEKFNNYKSFAFVRNPYIRTLSTYFDKVQLWTPYKITFEEINIDHFNWFLDCIFAQKDSDPNALDEHYLTQYEYVKNCDVRILRYEQIVSDWDSFSDDYEIKGKLPHMRRNSSHRPTSDYFVDLNKDCIDKINKLYEEDFINFNYNML